MIIEYDNEIMNLNDSFENYSFKIVCDTEDLISIINSSENAMKYFLSEWYKEVIDKKNFIVFVIKNNNLIACLKISCSGYFEDIVGYKSKFPVNYDELPVDYDEEIVIEDWGKKKNLSFLFPTQKEIDELLRS